MNLRILIFTCVFILGCAPQARKSIGPESPQKLRSLCQFESNFIFADYEQRLHGYLSELSTMFARINPALMTADGVMARIVTGEQYFNELRATFPLRAGMPINRVHSVIQQESFMKLTPHNSEDPSALWLFFSGDGASQDIFSSAWVEISVENDLVQSICIAPGNFSVVLPGFLFDGVLPQETFNKEKNVQKTGNR